MFFAKKHTDTNNYYIPPAWVVSVYPTPLLKLHLDLLSTRETKNSAINSYSGRTLTDSSCIYIDKNEKKKWT